MNDRAFNISMRTGTKFKTPFQTGEIFKYLLLIKKGKKRRSKKIIK
jgi:hypothetical protein